MAWLRCHDLGTEKATERSSKERSSSATSPPIASTYYSCIGESQARQPSQPAAAGKHTSSCTMLGCPAARRWNAICRLIAAASSAGPCSMKRITTGVYRSASRHRSTELQRPLRRRNGLVGYVKPHEHPAHRFLCSPVA